MMAEIVELQGAEAGEDNKVGEMSWSEEALSRLKQISDTSLQENIRLRAEKKARAEKSTEVSLTHLKGFLNNDSEDAQPRSKCPFAQNAGSVVEEAPTSLKLFWTTAALARLQQVPAGYCRNLTQRAVETLATQNNSQEVDLDYLEEVLKVFKAGSESADTSMPWTTDARERIQRAPDSVRGMLVKEIEGWAQREGLKEVDQRAVRAIKREWQSRGIFHLEPGDPRGDG